MNELECLYDLGRASDESGSVDEYLPSALDIIRRAMPNPSKIRLRISVWDKTFQSPDFEICTNIISEDLQAGGDMLGKLEIHCTCKRDSLADYRTLIRTFTGRISGAVRRLELEESLRVYSEHLEEMVEERTRDLEQAHEQVRLLSNTVKSSIDGITLADLEGSITFANEATEKMWGYSSDDLTGMRMSQLYAPSELDLVEMEIVPNSRASAWDGELSALRSDGKLFPVLVTTSPVYDENGQTVAIVGVHRDITDTKNMRDQLIRSERLAAVGELASGVGHELRNPLNVIRNCVYLLNMTLGDGADEDTLNALRLLDQQVDISNKIVTDLLNFTRIRPPSPSRVDLNSLVRESLSWVMMPEMVVVTTEFDEGCPGISTDPEQIGRAFANIAANGVQSMNGGGELKVRTGIDDGYAWVRFEDSGCGIPKENLDKIFQPLFTTKPKGIGLGLAITRGLVEQNGGAVEVSSQVDKGTAFTVRLPVC